MVVVKYFLVFSRNTTEFQPVRTSIGSIPFIKATLIHLPYDFNTSAIYNLLHNIVTATLTLFLQCFKMDFHMIE